jgi:hypothetical protein
MENSYKKLLTNFKPTYRQLRGYAFDPSLSNELKLATINSMTFNIRWEQNLQPGPVGDYLEVIDFDPASDAFYHQIDLNDPYVLAQNGLPPSEGNPLFHQQMVYAVAMLTIQNFEKALGRVTLWSSKDYTDKTHEAFVEKLRIYPHALREANAYYSPNKKAILFGYFPANPKNETILMPGSLVFTCLSHDIIAHEVTHALIDGLYKRYMVASHEDTLALHEGFSDIVALFQHFTFTEVLEHQIAQTRGRFEGNQLLSELAQQFGLAVGKYGSLRDAIGKKGEDNTWQPVKPDASAYRKITEPHARGSILVAAVFDAFVNIYNDQVRDLYRIATNGTGELPKGEIHPDLVKRLAFDASRVARQVLSMCIRALDYCPPINVTFGDYLRGIITADIDVVPFDSCNYRVAFVEAFKRWGIYPIGIRTLSVESLSYSPNTKEEFMNALDCYKDIEAELRDYFNSIGEYSTRKEVFDKNIKTKIAIHKLLVLAQDRDKASFEKMTGLIFTTHGNHWEEEFNRNNEYEFLNNEDENRTNDYVVKSSFLDQELDEIKIKKIKIAYTERENKKYSPSIEVHSIHRSQRVGPDGRIINHVIVTLLQQAAVEYTIKNDITPYIIDYKAGCTIVIAMGGSEEIKFIKKPVEDLERIRKQIVYRNNEDENISPFASHQRTNGSTNNKEPFAALHSS